MKWQKNSEERVTKMLIDVHVHTSGISRCSRRKPVEMIAQFISDKTD